MIVIDRNHEAQLHISKLGRLIHDYGQARSHAARHLAHAEHFDPGDAIVRHHLDKAQQYLKHANDLFAKIREHLACD